MDKFSRSITAAVLIMALSISPLGTPSRAPGVKGESQAEAQRALVGAYDSGQLNGVVFVTDAQNAFGLRILTYRPGFAVEDAPRSYEYGQCAPDGSFAQISWRTGFDDKTPVTMRWSRISDNVVVGRVTAPPNTRVAIETYRPWGETRADLGWTAFSAQTDGRTIFGEQVNNQTPKSPLRNFLIRTDRAAAGAADYNDVPAMRRTLVREGKAQQHGPRIEDRDVSRFAILSFDSASGAPAPPPSDPTTPNKSSITGVPGVMGPTGIVGPASVMAAAANAANPPNAINFVAMVGDDFGKMDADSNQILQKSVAGILDQEEKKYEDSRLTSGGAIGSTLTNFSRMVNWNRVYLPEKQLEFLALNRRNDRDLSNAALSWDTFFDTVVSSMVNDAAASATVRLLLEGQTPDGREPLRRYLQNRRRDESVVTSGRSMPPIGALCVWKVYLTTHDLGLLAYAYPKLRQWNEWWFNNRGDGQAWRDGNNDGLLEWGFDAELEQGELGARAMSNSAKQKLAFSESGLEDRPQWLGAGGPASRAANSAPTNPPQSPGDEAKYNDKTHTLEYSAVGLNALYALDTEILTMMARELGLPIESDRWQARYDQIRKNINEKLWDEETGLYLNRHWDGRFSHRLSPENFYPLLAGIADEEKVKRMAATLFDPKKFWGDHPLPSVSRDDPVFSDKVPGRGAIWAPMSYLVYLGLKRYGYHTEAAELARKNIAVTLFHLDRGGRVYDQFSSADGQPVSERSDEESDSQRAYFFGLMSWPAVEELLSPDLWAGLTFGSLGATEESRIEHAAFSGAKFDVILGPKRTVVRRNGAIEVECEAPVRLRAYRTDDRAITFAIEAKERTHILIPALEGRKITVSVDDKVLGSTSAGAAATFKVSGGAHKILIVK